MVIRTGLLTLAALCCVALLVTRVIASELPTNPAQIERITVAELQTLQSQASVVFIDTRTTGQWQRATDKVPGAVRLTSQAELEQFKQTFQPDTPIVVYCT